MMLFLENVNLALTAIKTNKMRSFLTMLGIIIGISSVIAITSIGASAKGAVTAEFEAMGSSYLYIMPNWEMMNTDDFSMNDFFTSEDINALKARFPEMIKYAVPYVSGSSATKVGRTDANLSILGVGANYDDYNKTLLMQSGRMILDSDIRGRKNVIVIQDKMAVRLFGSKDAALKKEVPVTLNGEQTDATVIGVFEEKESAFAGLATSNTYKCYMPYSTVLPAGEEYFNYIEIYCDPDTDIAAQGKSFTGYLENVKGKDEGFYTFESAESQMEMINKVLGILSIAIGAIAAISLLVGGIGIMNIMLVSVTERTREIGIRKSLGARTKDILTQFLIEAMILSVIGGGIGTLFGIGIGKIGMIVAGTQGIHMSLVIEPLTIIIAVLFSAGVGLFFGLFPAKKAAKLDPIEALRFE
ncbi:MAG: ABC transporter permease [Clostridia bacterium]|nr:ABC transporter permease [Clostridia bacterium]